MKNVFVSKRKKKSLEREAQGKVVLKGSTTGKEEARKNMRERKSEVRKKILYEVSSDETDTYETALCDDDETDNIKDVERCVVCNDTAKDNELWFRTHEVECGLIPSAQVRTTPITICVTTDWCDTIFLFTTYHNSFIIS
jgi:hypothetical protein